MALPRAPRLLDEIVGRLLAPLLAAAPRPGGFRLASWDVEQGVCLTLARGDEWILVEFEPRDDTRPCWARTRRFNVNVRHQFEPTRALDPLAVRTVEQLVALVAARESLLPILPSGPHAPGAEVREVLVERMLVAQAPGHYYLNAYAGCMIGCEFCYVAERAALSRGLEGLPPRPWGRWVDVKVNAADVLAREVQTLAPGVVRMSPILTDPYQPLERRYRITRACLEVLRPAGFVPAILTRAGRVQDDAALLARFETAFVGLSIPTDDDEIRAIFEPGGDPIEARFEALEALRRHGVSTAAVIQPMLPMNPERLAERLAASVGVVRIDRMYDAEKVRHLYARAGRLDALDDAFFADTEARLRAALAARGVAVDPLDDVLSLSAS